METEIKTDAADLSKKYFFIVSNALIDHCSNLKISSGQLHLLLTIIRHAYQNDSAYPSLSTLQRKTGLSQPTIISNLRKLEEKGYIIKTRQFRDNNGQSNNLYSFKPLNNILERLIKDENIEDILTPLKNFNPPSKDSLDTPLKNFNPNNTYNNKTNNNKTNNNKTKDGADKSTLILDSIKIEVLNYLNEKTGKSFSVKNKNNLQNIGARLLDGFTAEQLKSVIDKKTAEWLNDEKMNQYLNPETLFRPKKFEIYLNSKLQGAETAGITDENKYANVKTTHIDNVTGEMWVTGG